MKKQSKRGSPRKVEERKVEERKIEDSGDGHEN
jgi:hypothetical protein